MTVPEVTITEAFGKKLVFMNCLYNQSCETCRYTKGCDKI